MKPKTLDHSSINTLLGNLRTNVYYQFRADNLTITSPIWQYRFHDIPSLLAVQLAMLHHGYGRVMCDLHYTHIFSVIYRLGGIGLRPSGGDSGDNELSRWLYNQASVSTGLIHIVEPQRGPDGTICARVRFHGEEGAFVDDFQRSQLDKNLKGVFS